MEFRLLGPLEVSDYNRPIEIGRGRRRALLALLLMRPNEVISAERLIDELWGEQPTATATKSLHVYVSQLRKELHASGNGEVLLTRGNGYVAQVAPDDVDVARFERLVAEGRQLLAGGDPAVRASGSARRWPCGAGRRCPTSPTSRSPRRTSPAWRSSASSHSRPASRRTSRSAATPSSPASWRCSLREHPLRERLRGQLMLALYRCGRQAEALDVYRAGRAALVDELGIEPGPALRELQEKILAQSADLAPPAAPRRPRRPPAAAPALQRPRRRALAL